MNNKHRVKHGKIKPGQVWILLGVLLILAAALLIGKNLLEQQSAARLSASLLEQAQRQMEESASAMPTTSSPTLDGLSEGRSEENTQTSADWSGYDIAGVLSLPDLGLELPVLADYSENLLKVSVCIFDWEDNQDPPRMVIAGHNYKAHFGSISKLLVGAKIKYKPLDGKENRFQVSEIVEISADDGAALEDGEWDLTLLTCNFDMSKRILVRCIKEAQ